jgi:hypothetical protein
MRSLAPDTCGHDGVVIRRRLEHTVVLAIAIELSMVIGFGAFMLAPRWKLQALGPTATGDKLFIPVSWSPDGAALLTSATSGSALVRSEAILLLGREPGSSPVWVDDTTLLRLERIDESTYRLVRLDAGDGHRELIGEPMPWGDLITDGRGHVAHQILGMSPSITVIDPNDGRRLAELKGYAAQTWTDDGALIVKRPEPDLDRYFLDPGALFYWRQGESPRALGASLVDAGNVAPLSPAGDAIACICVAMPFPSEPPPDGPEREIFRIPVDGSTPTRLAPWPTYGGSSPEIAWTDETSLAAVGDGGLVRVPGTGGVRPVPGLSASDLGFQTMFGRVYRIREQLVAVLQDLVGGTDALLVVIDEHDRIRMRRWSTGQMPVIAVDVAHERGAIGTEYRVPGEPSSWEISMLEFR